MNKSESIAKLSTSLIKFHQQVGKIKKDAKNPFFKSEYASLSNILDVVSEPLTSNGLAVIQFPKDSNCLETILIHESGEYISQDYIMNPSKNDPQGIGSAITYQRRYALGAILSLNIDEDDDGNKASQSSKEASNNEIKRWFNESDYNAIVELVKKDKKAALSLVKTFKDGQKGISKAYQEKVNLLFK